MARQRQPDIVLVTYRASAAILADPPSLEAWFDPAWWRAWAEQIVSEGSGDAGATGDLGGGGLRGGGDVWAAVADGEE